MRIILAGSALAIMGALPGSALARDEAPTEVTVEAGKPGAQLVALPEELQNYTGFTAGTPAGAKQSEAVSALIRFLQSPAVAGTMKAKGMQQD